ncbi:MAG: SRPBCC family protein [Xanthomonadales bacterium]|jgi:hypothetical protein|nr:SRPBCC family protein [Xanthomonadales bacterium]
MTRFIEFVIALLLVAVLFVIVGVALPDHRNVRHSVETNRPVRLVYDLLNGFQRFAEWHPLRMHDPAIKYTLEGEGRGVGAVLRYQSENDKIGTGTLTITDSIEDSSIEFTIENAAYGTNKTSVFTLDERGKTVDINWEYDVDYGWNLFGRYAGLYVSRTVGDDLKLGLGNLTGLLSTIPNHDYSTIVIEEVDLPARNVLFVTTTADRNITAVEEGLDAGIKQVRAAMSANGLEATGPVRLITTNFADKKYEFDVAIPVQRPGAASAEPSAAEGDATSMTEVAVALAPEPLEGLKLPEKVQLGVSYAGKALKAHYAGHPASLPLIRDMVRAYAATHGKPVHDRAFEEYLNELNVSVDQTEFEVYWPIK